MASINTCYISCGCNRTPFSADWGRNNLICYASCRAVAIYRPESWSTKPASVVSTLTGHQDRVNCVQWIRNPDNSNEDELVSGSVDKTVRVWRQEGEHYSLTTTLKGHTGAVNAVATVKVCPNVFDHNTATVYIATASTDSTVRIWRREPEKDFEEVQVLTFGTGFVLTVAFSLIPDTNIPVLACGADDSKIHLYVLQEGQFVRKRVLTGHEDWVRGMEFAMEDGGDLLLASCSQDHFIRIWRLAGRDSNTGTSSSSISCLSLEEDIKMRENTFAFHHNGVEKFLAVSLESVLSGHENWIYTVRWRPQEMKGNQWHQPMSLLSASMDKTMIVWQFDVAAGVWLEMVRVGEVGGNSLGFYGGLMSPDGQSILAHGYHGAFHQWSHQQSTLTWEPTVTGGGHFASVQDVDWDREGGEFLVSVSEDQTTRLHAPWVTPDRETCWYELARPQIHGYDLQCLSMISRYQFVSGADEKVARVFHAPRNFIDNFCQICGVPLDTELKKKTVSSLPEGASVPALGLSNKAIFQGDDSLKTDRELQRHPNEQYPDVYFTPVALTAPPSEENLLQNTLWPETQKLYGHGYEVFALASNPAGTVVATACKASKAEFANILLWDTSTWRQIGSLEGATLTVTQMAFSPSGQYLLAVSRDRTWSLYQQTGETWERVSSVDKKTSHSRIIWACCWTHDDQYYITVSRDKKAMVWSLCSVTEDRGAAKAVSSLVLSESVTAVDSAPCTVGGQYLFAVGLESGQVLLYRWCAKDRSWTCCHTLTQSNAHHLAVKRLRFRPRLGRAGSTGPGSWLQLASCGLDHAVKVHDIDISKL
ncbi:elongator complex protein 2-like [Haliotis cracherodii]|uniref:elongator complex protein 2-like n=1 Tax=Haliotis cracherodii TaxID=6455 RepID=UPI0039E9353A